MSKYKQLLEKMRSLTYKNFFGYADDVGSISVYPEVTNEDPRAENMLVYFKDRMTDHKGVSVVAEWADKYFYPKGTLEYELLSAKGESWKAEIVAPKQLEDSIKYLLDIENMLDGNITPSNAIFTHIDIIYRRISEMEPEIREIMDKQSKKMKEKGPLNEEDWKDKGSRSYTYNCLREVAGETFKSSQQSYFKNMESKGVLEVLASFAEEVAKTLYIQRSAGRG